MRRVGNLNARRPSRERETIDAVVEGVRKALAAAKSAAEEITLPVDKIAARIDLPTQIIQCVLRDDTERVRLALGVQTVAYIFAGPHKKQPQLFIRRAPTPV